MLVGVAALTMSPVGATGGMSSAAGDSGPGGGELGVVGQAVVVALVVARGEGLPAASTADTPTAYFVPQMRSESVARVSVTVVVWAPPSHTR